MQRVPFLSMLWMNWSMGIDFRLIIHGFRNAKWGNGYTGIINGSGHIAHKTELCTCKYQTVHVTHKFAHNIN